MAEPAPFGFARPGQRYRPLLRTLLGEVLRRTRQEQRRTLADVARAAKVSMPYLSEVERGRKEASSEVLAAICEALGLDLSDLLTHVGRDLVELRERRARRDRIVRLGVVGGPAEQPEGMRGRAAPPDTIRDGSAPGSELGSARCLLAA